MGRANSKPRDLNPTLDYEILGFTETGEDVNIPLSEFSKVLASEIASELGITGVPPGSVLVVSDSGDKLEQLLLGESFEIVDENGVKTLKLVSSACCNDTDATKPIITLLGANSVSALQNTIYSDAGATAEDDVDGNITSAIVVGGDSVNTATPGSYIITYNVSDAAGNAADEVVRYVSVVAIDSTAPVITLIGDNPVSITEGNNYSEAGATAQDDVDGDVSSNIIVDSSSLDNNTVGSYTITYNVSDQAGNAANEVTRVVNVVAVVIPNPIQPISLTVDLVDEVNATFSWDTAGNDPANSYMLEYMSVGDLPDWNNATQVMLGANVTTYSMLIPDSERAVSVARVTAVNSQGSSSQASDYESYDSRDRTDPVQGGVLSVSQDSGGLAALTWQAATDNVGVTSYELTYRVLGSDPSTATTLTLTPSTLSQAVSVADGDWFFTIQAFDAAGNSSTIKSSQISINNAVTESVVLSVNLVDSAADLSWVTTPSDVPLNYTAYSNPVVSGDPVTSDWDTSDTVQFSVANKYYIFRDLATGFYDFKVDAINSVGNVVESNIVREYVVNSQQAVTIYYGQTTDMGVLDNVINNSLVVAAPEENSAYTLIKDTTVEGPESTHLVPFLGSSFFSPIDFPKKVHFILIPTTHTLQSSVNNQFTSDVFLPVTDADRAYDPAGTGSPVSFKGGTFKVWAMELSNPLDVNIEIVVVPNSL